MKPRLLDLFCGAGLAADGYAAAGFEVTGVDLFPQPDYPYEFYQLDALYVLKSRTVGIARGYFLMDFDAVHVSPPCQAHTRAGHLRTAQGGTSKFEDLLTPTLELLADVRNPWIVENVEGAPGMDNAITLCGSSFGLGVRRHRLFLSNVALLSMPCIHRNQGRPWGVFHVPNDDIPKGGRTARDLAHGKEVMGVPADRACTWNELKEAIPPAYTEFLGAQLLEHVKVAS